MTCKVLHLITHLGVGGAQDNTLHTVGGLDRARYEVHLGAGVGEDDWVGRARALADRVYLIPPLIKPIAPWHDLAALRALVALIRQERYAIVHTHSSKAGVLGRIAARLAGVPLVIHTVHGLPWSQHTPAPLRLVYQRIEAYLARHSQHLITVAESNRQELIACGVAGPAQVTTIYSGIDCAPPQPPLDRAALCHTLGLDPHKPIVGSVARLSPQKAPLDLLRAIKLVQAQIPGAQCVLVGDGPLRQQVEAAARGMGRVLLLGSRDDVAALLPLFDVFALASHWEGLGRAVSEALLAGLPAAVTAVNGVPELVA
ncbi:MAG: glycosyltransferase, partial [Chloroflexales bacterium]|nr:glycosyltransferase [Chloroflexales bacterium]